MQKKQSEVSRMDAARKYRQEDLSGSFVEGFLPGL
jgi:hypothetical protein